ncbi:MAG TPA: hypothetical protein VFL82_03085 [Thermomicrobiales bacterium]|nr:hypothetical protein [Thermomicrobiales bacterium]
MSAAKLDQMGQVLTQRYKAGPQQRKPGEMTASDWAWWDDFWQGHKGDHTHKVAEDLAEADSPQRRGAARTAHDMTDQELLNYCRGKGWIRDPNNPHPQPPQQDTVGNQMVKDVVRKELVRRGRPVYF